MADRDWEDLAITRGQKLEDLAELLLHERAEKQAHATRARDAMRRIVLLEAALREFVDDHGVVSDDPRLGYVEIQVNPGAIERARRVLEGDPRRDPPADQGVPAMSSTAESKPGTLRALDGDRVIYFKDYVFDGDEVEVYRSFEDAVCESGASVRKVVRRDGDEWFLDERVRP